MSERKIGTREEWQAARDELARLEAEQAERNEEIKSKRLDLPCVRVEKEFFQFVTSKRPVAVELLDHVGRASPVFGASRKRVTAAGEPLLRAAQDSGDVQAGLSLDQILDMIVAIAKIPGGPDYVQPILRTALAGLSRPAAS